MLKVILSVLKLKNNNYLAKNKRVSVSNFGSPNPLFCICFCF